MNLNQIIEKKKEEFKKEMRCSCIFEVDALEDVACEAHGITAIRYKRFLEKAIRESVEEALREVIVFEKTGTTVYMAGYEDAMKDISVRIKEFMK